jgi:dTDP-4-amino-4,6-dideoxy-D-galactose acyltransferase
MAATETRNGTTVCEILDWDSTFFGCRIARFRPERCLPEDRAAIAAECDARDIACVYLLVDASDTASIDNLQQMRAHLTDTRITFGTAVPRTVEAAPSRHGAVLVRPAIGADIDALAGIASVSHRDTRFHADRHFNSARCDRLYEVWIENSCRGFADVVLVAEDVNGRLAGYVTCHKSTGTDRGHIGLFAVGADAQGRGVGSALLQGALDWCQASDVREMTVATQLRNLRAVQFYARRGLLLTSAALWFHFWPRDVHV